MSHESGLTEILLGAAGVQPLTAVYRAVLQAGAQPPPMALLAAAAGAVPHFCFSPELDAADLIAAAFGSDPLGDMARIAGVEACWSADPGEIAEHLGGGGVAVAATAEGWQVLDSGAARHGRVAAQLCGHALSPAGRGPWALLLSGAGGGAKWPRADEVVRSMAQASQDRAVDFDGLSASCGPVAVDALRRALSGAAQEGFEKWPRAREWLRLLPLEIAASMFLAAEALRHVAGSVSADRHLQMAMHAAGGNFDAAAAFAAGVRVLAEASLDWPRRSGTDERAPDPAHWGTIYEMLRQTSYHWRSAAGWLARELVRVQNLVADAGD